MWFASGGPGKNPWPGTNTTPRSAALGRRGLVSTPDGSVTQRKIPPWGRVHDPPSRKGPRHRREHQAPLPPVHRADLREVAVQHPEAEVPLSDPLAEGVREQVDTLLREGHLPDHVRVARGPADAEPGREDLAEAAHGDHPALLVEGRDGREVLPLEPQVVIRVVPDDEDPVLRGEVRAAAPAAAGHRDPGGVVGRRGDVKELRPAAP